jgi:hypothetical protein
MHNPGAYFFAEIDMATKFDASEIMNPKKTLKRREEEAEAPAPAPAPAASKPAMSQSDFSGYSGKKKAGPPAEMLKKHEADDKKRLKDRGYY